jgi:nucleotide-binding universal stress UspA family protein
MSTASGGRVVVGVDGSASSIEALQWVRPIATALGAEIQTVTAWEYPASYGLGAVPDNWQPDVDAARQANDAVTAAFGSSSPDGVTVTVAEGQAAEVLLAASAGAQLLVVGSRGHGGFVGLLLGSVSTYCAEHATCPVVVFHTDSAAPEVEAADK